MAKWLPAESDMLGMRLNLAFQLIATAKEFLVECSMKDMEINKENARIAARLAVAFAIALICSGWSELSWAIVGMPTHGISAHRGASVTHPENTLAAFRESIWQGAQQIEFDVDSSLDGIPVVMHDTTVNRTTNGSGAVTSLTLAQLKSLDAGIWKGPQFTNERIPTLAETLAIMPENIWLNVHMRGGYDTAYATATEIFAQNREHQAFMSIVASQRQGVLDAAADAGKTILINNMQNQGMSESYVLQTIANGDDFLQILSNGTLPNPTHVQWLQDAGVKMNYCCVSGDIQSSDRETLRNLFEAGVEFPLVDDVIDGVAAAEQVGVLPLVAQYRDTPTVASLGVNTIANPGAELWFNDSRVPTTAALPTTDPLLTRDRELFGWRDVVDVTNVPYAASGVTPSASNFPIGQFGKNAFTGGHSLGTRWIEQSIDLDTLTSLVDLGSLDFELSAWLGGQAGKTDYTSLWATFVDSNGVALDSARLTTLSPSDWGGTTNLVELSTTGTVPSGARSVTVQLHFNGQNGTIAGGLADNLSLIFAETAVGSATVPEPSTLLILASVAIGLSAADRRNASRAAP